MGINSFEQGKIFFNEDNKVIDKKNILNKISLLAFTFFIFLFTSFISAQVIIKEKVEINPQEVQYCRITQFKVIQCELIFNGHLQM